MQSTNISRGLKRQDKIRFKLKQSVLPSALLTFGAGQFFAAGVCFVD